MIAGATWMKHAVWALAVALVTSTGLATAAAPAAEAAIRKVALGVSQADDRNLAAVDAFKDSVGRWPAIWAVWSDWGGADQDFPTSFMNGLKSRGIVPMVNWQPIDPANPTCESWSLDNIINGDHDDYIRAWATAAKAYGGRVVLRFAHEMNGYWFPWGYGRCDNSTTKGKFKSAWRHVWNIFRGPGGVGATNVKFLWSIYGTSRLAYHYPGDNYVDYVGLTALNWGPDDPHNPHPWASMVSTFTPTMTALRRLTSKLVIAAEVGAADDPCGVCDKTAWITQGYPAVYAKWPRLKALVYFDLDMRFVGQPDWRLGSPSAAFTAYRTIVAQPKFQGSIP